MQNLRRKYPQIQEKARCRCNLYIIGRTKSICKFKEKQVADTVGSKRASARVNIKALQIQWLQKRASATVNIKVLQIQQLQKSHLQQQINREYRYIRYQKNESTHPSIYFNHGTPPRKKRLCNPANWSRVCPTKLPQECIVFFLLGIVVN